MATSLSLPQAEFALGSWGATLIMCEGIQSVNTSLVSLKELTDIQEKIMVDCKKLEREMEQFECHVFTEVDWVMATIREPNRNHIGSFWYYWHELTIYVSQSLTISSASKVNIYTHRFWNILCLDVFNNVIYDLQENFPSHVSLRRHRTLPWSRNTISRDMSDFLTSVSYSLVYDSV